MKRCNSSFSSCFDKQLQQKSVSHLCRTPSSTPTTVPAAAPITAQRSTQSLKSAKSQRTHPLRCVHGAVLHSHHQLMLLCAARRESAKARLVCACCCHLYLHISVLLINLQSFHKSTKKFFHSFTRRKGNNIEIAAHLFLESHQHLSACSCARSQGIIMPSPLPCDWHYIPLVDSTTTVRQIAKE